jgi:hypothetical protein
MAQRDSGYARKARDAYMTPPWVTESLLSVLGARLTAGDRVWEPAAGTGQMVDVLRRRGLAVYASDIEPTAAAIGRDFVADALGEDTPPNIITNPPYILPLCDRFIATALERTREARGLVAMLLKIDYDSARTRAPLFAQHPAWGLKIVLTDRIHWFDPEMPPPGEKQASGPSENHAWYVWDWRWAGSKSGLSARIAYRGAPEPVKAAIAAKRAAIEAAIKRRDAAHKDLLEAA